MQPPTCEQLTKELHEFTECAKAVLPNFKLKPRAVVAYRQSSAEEAKPSVKKPKTKGVIPVKSFVHVVRNLIIISGLDEVDLKRKISRAQWSWMELRIWYE